MGTVIDTSLLVAAERGTFDLDQFLSGYPGERWFISAVSVSEMLHGVLRSARLLGAPSDSHSRRTKSSASRYWRLIFPRRVRMRGSGRNSLVAVAQLVSAI